MYEDAYGLREKPFSLLPDPEFLYFSGKHKSAFSALEYGLTAQAGFTVITGEVGSGKTTLVRNLLQQIDPDITVGLITHTPNRFEHLLQWIFLAFGLDYRDKRKVELYEEFVDYLIAEYGTGRRSVLIIDEAQILDASTLEELRMLSNVNSDKDLLLQVILVGQPELMDTLNGPEFRQFAQRISISYHLEALDREETRGYIRHRLKIAGGDPELFSRAACDAVYQLSKGVPRLINGLCDLSLVYGFGDDKRRIDLDTVLAVFEDRGQASLAANAEAASATRLGEEIRQLRRAEDGKSAEQKDLRNTAVSTASGESVVQLFREAAADFDPAGLDEEGPALAPEVPDEAIPETATVDDADQDQAERHETRARRPGRKRAKGEPSAQSAEMIPLDEVAGPSQPRRHLWLFAILFLAVVGASVWLAIRPRPAVEPAALESESRMEPAAAADRPQSTAPAPAPVLQQEPTRTFDPESPREEEPAAQVQPSRPAVATVPQGRSLGAVASQSSEAGASATAGAESSATEDRQATARQGLSEDVDDPLRLGAATPLADPAPSVAEKNEPVSASVGAAATSSVSEPSVSQAVVGSSGGPRYVVQFMSARSESQAQSEAERLRQSLPELADLTPFSIESAEVGEAGTFFRLLSPLFDERGRAVSLCEAVKDKGFDCFVKRR